MKRPYVRRKATGRTGDLKQDLSHDQLAEIGAVAIAYNHTEIMIDRMLAIALNLTVHMHRQVTSRINGVENKIDILKLALSDLEIPERTQNLIADALGNGAFKRLKSYRDAVVHARILDQTRQLGELIERQGKHSEVLLSVEALSRLYDNLVCLQMELASYALIIHHSKLMLDLAEHDPERARAPAEASPTRPTLHLVHVVST
jgi:hypothetical protein